MYTYVYLCDNTSKFKKNETLLNASMNLENLLKYLKVKMLCNKYLFILAY